MPYSYKLDIETCVQRIGEFLAIVDGGKAFSFSQQLFW